MFLINEDTRGAAMDENTNTYKTGISFSLKRARVLIYHDTIRALGDPVCFRFLINKIDKKIERPDVFLFKIAFNAFFFEFPDRRQAVHSVAGKPADALGHDEINLPSECIIDHGLEADTPFYAGSADTFIRVHINKFPVIPAFDVVGAWYM